MDDNFFFFKQKTAYEMRISDWSSDVCSSDLTGGDERLRELQSDAATQSQDTRVERLVASKPAGLRYGSAARHIVDETPGGRAAPAPQQADRKSTRLNSSH